MSQEIIFQSWDEDEVQIRKMSKSGSFVFFLHVCTPVRRLFCFVWLDKWQMSMRKLNELHSHRQVYQNHRIPASFAILFALFFCSHQDTDHKVFCSNRIHSNKTCSCILTAVCAWFLRKTVSCEYVQNLLSPTYVRTGEKGQCILNALGFHQFLTTIMPMMDVFLFWLSSCFQQAKHIEDDK